MNRLTDDRSTWLGTGPLTAEQRETTIASLRDGDITASEAASLLGCSPTTARELAAGVHHCEHPGLDTSGSCIECGERCTMVAMQGPMCLDHDCPIHSTRPPTAPESSC